MEVRGGVHL